MFAGVDNSIVYLHYVLNLGRLDKPVFSKMDVFYLH